MQQAPDEAAYKSVAVEEAEAQTGIRTRNAPTPAAVLES